MCIKINVFCKNNAPNSVMATREKGRWEEVEEGKGAIKGGGKKLDFGW